MGVINDSIKSPDVDSPEYEAWLFKDQLVMSWILNLMDHNLAKVFSYLESYLDLWNVVHDMYDNQNNSARIFQIHRDIANLHQDGKPFVQLLVSLKGPWKELRCIIPILSMLLFCEKEQKMTVFFSFWLVLA